MELIERYERTHGYEFIARNQLGLEVTSRKPVVRSGRVIGYVEIDACTFEDPKPSSFHENPERQLPYSLTAERRYRREVKLSQDAICYIPCKPLLLLYKIKALRDRAYDLKTKGAIIEPAKVEKLRGKITKDRADILSLLDPKPSRYTVKEHLDTETFHNLVKRFKLEFTLETLTELPKYHDAIQLYNPNLKEEQIQKWLKTVMR